MNLDWLDSMYRRLVKEVAGKAVGLEKRIEIRKQLTVIRRVKRKLKE
ncbi:hypothetical protein GMA19_01529 [Paenibacillus polymyxa E681]|nr:hypothetical protein PPE_01518 [Paenibacillus polymyxa E681]QNV56368.1 hypothetical protein GE561_01529 [Paenibacillus polymyxa E681]QNV61205.1 hypothetical protein GMA19_01529 [Paenibacillus polymyxa E681]